MNTIQDVARVMRMVQEDVEAEAMALDGTPFTGRAVAEQFGNLLAEVKAVARGVELLATQMAGSGSSHLEALREELRDLEAAFAAAGGRGVEMADRIDELQEEIDRLEVQE